MVQGLDISIVSLCRVGRTNYSEILLKFCQSAELGGRDSVSLISCWWWFSESVKLDLKEDNKSSVRKNSEEEEQTCWRANEGAVPRNTQGAGLIKGVARKRRGRKLRGESNTALRTWRSAHSY